MTESDLAQRLHRDLGGLSEDAGWSPLPTEGQAQGHYTDPIADGKEAIDYEGDLADATPKEIRRIRLAAINVCCDRLIFHYSAVVNVSADGQSESLGDIIGHIERAREAVVGRVGIGQNLRGYRRPNYTLKGGNEPAETIHE